MNMKVIYHQKYSRNVSWLTAAAGVVVIFIATSPFACGAGSVITPFSFLRANHDLTVSANGSVISQQTPLGNLVLGVYSSAKNRANLGQFRVGDPASWAENNLAPPPVQVTQGFPPPDAASPVAMPGSSADGITATSTAPKLAAQPTPNPDPAHQAADASSIATPVHTNGRALSQPALAASSPDELRKPDTTITTTTTTTVTRILIRPARDTSMAAVNTAATGFSPSRPSVVLTSADLAVNQSAASAPATPQITATSRPVVAWVELARKFFFPAVIILCGSFLICIRKVMDWLCCG